jgi:N-hydroxyarylamine O-acetyltransferase
MKNNSSSPFFGLYAPLTDIRSYLQRIKFEGEPEPTLDCLEKLMTCQLLAIPFENLDVYQGGLVPSLETAALFEKIILNCRGGYCFELNGLFLKLLQAIGFTCFASTARITIGRDYVTPPTHEIIWVRIDGKLYLCDVGYGGPAPLCPLELAFDREFAARSGYTYRFTRSPLGIILEVNIDGAFQPMMTLSQTPCEPVDFLPLNRFCATSPSAPFQSRQILYRPTPNGKCTINNNLLRIKENDTVTETAVKTVDELRDALRRWFGITYSKALRLE